MKSPSLTPDSADYVAINVGGIPSTFQVKANLDASKYGIKTELRIKGMESTSGSEDGKIIGLLGAGAKFLLGLTPIGPVVSGAIFFSEWLKVPARSTDSGVNEYASNVHFSYYPQSSSYDQGGFRYEEFQTLIAVDFKAPVESKGDWVVAPFEISARLITVKSELIVETDLGRSMAMWFDPYNHVILFSEDFEHDITGWNVGDDNELSGSDHWGIVSSDISGKLSQAAWCAREGTNSITGDSNLQSRKYDKSMDAYLTRELDLRPFQYAEVSYDLFTYHTMPSDYLVLEYYPGTGGIWKTLKGPYGQDPSHYTWFSDNAIIPNNATGIRFRFHSNNDNSIDLGPSIDNVQVKAVIHNDASTMSDAGNLNEMSQAASISVSGSISNYAGYLDPSQPDNHDWYKFQARGSQIIYVSLHTQGGPNFDIKLYDYQGSILQGPSDTINYTTPYFYPTCDWYFDIYIVTGFGQYDFDIKLYNAPPVGGAGGCPYVSTWNGSQYVLDNNLIPAAEHSGGTDMTDYYLLEQPLIRNNGRYPLLIWDLDKHSFLDYVQLLAVDHESAINVAVSPYGEILTYRNPAALVSATNQYGRDVTNSLNTADGEYFEGYMGDYVLLNFGGLNVTDGAKLVVGADACDTDQCKESVHIQIQDGTGEWVNVTRIVPRMHWTTEIVDLSCYLSEIVGDIKVRLYFTAHHNIDYVGMDTSKQAEFTLHYSNLVVADHTRLGDVKEPFGKSDNLYVELLPGEQVALRFTLPQTLKEERDFIIVLEGHYFQTS